MIDEKTIAWISLFCIIFIFISTIAFAYSFEIITFAEILGKDCEFEFVESEGDLNYSGRWNCKTELKQLQGNVYED